MTERFDLFISYASANTNEAQQIERNATSLGLRVFLAKRLKPGERWSEKIREALLHSREIAVLASPESLTSEWVYTEWGAAWLLERTITAVLFDITVDKLPQRLREFQTADFYRLDEYLDSVTSRLSHGIEEGIYPEFARSPLMVETLLAPKILNSPLALDSLLGLAKQHIFTAAQNLYTPLVSNAAKTQVEIWDFLRKRSGPRILDSAISASSGQAASLAADS